MKLEMLAALPKLRTNKPSVLQDDLTRLLTEHMADQPVTIKGARDRFSEINRRAKEGYIQVIKGAPGQETVIVSLTDLAAMLHATATGVSLADALKISGFTPVRQKRLVLGEGMKTETELVLHKKRVKAKSMTAAGAL
jgi:hypothetical protein